MLDGLVEACLPGSLGRRLQRLEEAARVGVLEEGPVAVVGSAAVPGDLAITVQSVSQLVYHQCLISCAWKKGGMRQLIFGASYVNYRAT